MPPAKPATIAPWLGWVFRDREIYPDASGDGGLATAEWRELASSDRLPVHRSESPTGYFSAGCSPAEPASASPVTDNGSSNPDPPRQSNALLNFTAGMQSVALVASAANGSVISTLRAGCHFYLAPTWLEIELVAPAHHLLHFRGNIASRGTL
jgi:hypothetical protein